MAYEQKTRPTDEDVSRYLHSVEPARRRAQGLARCVQPGCWSATRSRPTPRPGRRRGRLAGTAPRFAPGLDPRAVAERIVAGIEADETVITAKGFQVD